MGFQSAGTSPDDVTLETNVSGKLQVRDEGIGSQHLALYAVTLDKIAPGTQGDILYYGVDGAPSLLPKGSASQILSMNGGATAPEWTAPPSSDEGWVQLATYTNATLGATKTTIASGLAAYDEYKIVGYAESLYTSGTNTLHLFMNEETGAGKYAGQQVNAANTLSSFSNSAGDGISLIGFLNATSDKLAVPIRFECFGAGSAQASGKLGFCNQPAAFANSCALSGYFIAGNGVRITSFSMRSNAGTTNVKVKVFGRNA